MTDLEQWARTIITVSAALSLLSYGAHRIYLRIMVPMLDNINAAADIIQSQLTPNGGSNLLDHVSQIPNIRSDISGLTHRVEKIEQVLATPKEFPNDQQ